MSKVIFEPRPARYIIEERETEHHPAGQAKAHRWIGYAAYTERTQAEAEAAHLANLNPHTRYRVIDTQEDA